LLDMVITGQLIRGWESRWHLSCRVQTVCQPKNETAKGRDPFRGSAQ
jgi:hypothetical protein